MIRPLAICMILIIELKLINFNVCSYYIRLWNAGGANRATMKTKKKKMSDKIRNSMKSN